MDNFVIVGLGRFGRCMLEGLAQRRRHVIVIDRNEEKIQQARDLATKAIKADAVNRDLLAELLPEGVHCAIVDLGDLIGQSILVTNYLAKMKVDEIVVEAVNSEHAEILRIVGATRVVFPEKEAAERLVGMLAGGGLLDFFAVSEGFAMIEIPVPDDWVGRTPPDLELQAKKGIEVVAVRRSAATAAQERWSLVDQKRAFQTGEIVLLAGNSKDLERIGR